MRWGRRGGRAGRCVGGLAPASQLAPFGSPQPDAVAGSEAPRRLVLQPGHRGESQRAAEGSQGHRSGRNQGEAQAEASPGACAAAPVGGGAEGSRGGRAHAVAASAGPCQPSPRREGSGAHEGAGSMAPK